MHQLVLGDEARGVDEAVPWKQRVCFRTTRLIFDAPGCTGASIEAPSCELLRNYNRLTAGNYQCVFELRTAAAIAGAKGPPIGVLHRQGSARR